MAGWLSVCFHVAAGGWFWMLGAADNSTPAYCHLAHHSRFDQHPAHRSSSVSDLTVYSCIAWPRRPFARSCAALPKAWRTSPPTDEPLRPTSVAMTCLTLLATMAPEEATVLAPSGGPLWAARDSSEDHTTAPASSCSPVIVRSAETGMPSTLLRPAASVVSEHPAGVISNVREDVSSQLLSSLCQ